LKNIVTLKSSFGVLHPRIYAGCVHVKSTDYFTWAVFLLLWVWV